MKEKKINYKITKRERDVLEILWNNPSPLLASDIQKISPSLSMSSIQMALRNLLSKNLIEIADIVYSGTVLSRSYQPIIDRADFINNEVLNNLQGIEKKIILKNLVTTLLKHEKNNEEIIRELELLLEEKKKELLNRG